jgi:cell wall-associated NlpC family hydrolase
MAYGYPTTADYYAIDQWRNMPTRYRHTGTSAPAGALMYWDTGKRAGHIAISLGDGMVASTDTGPGGGIGIHPVSYFAGYGQLVGWTDPYFRNQTTEGARA